MPVLEQYMKYASLPVIVKPNAGLPVQRDGHTCYDVLPETFAAYMQKIAGTGALHHRRMLRDNAGPYPGHDGEMPGDEDPADDGKERYDRVLLRERGLPRERVKDHRRADQPDRKKAV